MSVKNSCPLVGIISQLLKRTQEFESPLIQELTINKNVYESKWIFQLNHYSRPKHIAQVERIIEEHQTWITFWRETESTGGSTIKVINILKILEGGENYTTRSVC